MMYAILENDVVVEIIGSSSGKAVIGLNAIRLYDIRVSIGDIYEDGKFYRDGVEVLTPVEEANRKINKLEADNDTMLINYEYQLAVLTPVPMALDYEPIGNENISIYEALKRIINRRQIDEIKDKLNVFLAVGKITNNWYEELVDLINAVNN